jgi:hypothetical protein
MVVRIGLKLSELFFLLNDFRSFTSTEAIES